MDIIPAAWLDQTVPVNNIRTRMFFVVYAELDEKRLRNALDQLIRQHWRKLGGRLVPNQQSGRLEYHVPHVFSDDYVLFNWSSSRTPHEVRVPSPTPPGLGVTIHEPAGALILPFIPDDWPLERKHELSNAPLLWVHLSYFSDATVVGFNLPHAVSDQLGFSSIIKAWLGLVSGQVPPPLLELKDKDMESPNEKQLSQTQIKGHLRLMTKWEQIRQMMGLATELVLDLGDPVHTFFIPLPVAQALRERCTKDLKVKYGEDVFVSEADVVCAVLVKLSQLHRKTPQMLHFYQAISVRGRVPAFPRDNTYIHNAVILGGSRFPAWRETTIADCAWHIRLGIIDTVKPNNLETTLAVAREYSRRKQQMLLYEPGDRSFHVTNWAAAWHGIDFGPAVTGGNTSAHGEPVRMLVLGQSREMSTAIHRFDSQIMCKTEEGYWCNFATGTKTMKLVKAYLDQDPLLMDTVKTSSDPSLVTPLFLAVACMILILSYVLYSMR